MKLFETFIGCYLVAVFFIIIVFNILGIEIWGEVYIMFLVTTVLAIGSCLCVKKD